MEALFAPVPDPGGGYRDPRTGYPDPGGGYPAPYGPEHQLPPGAAPHRPPAEPAPRRAHRDGTRRRRRQWGHDRRTRAMPMVPKPVSDRRVAMGRLAIIVTVTAWIGYLHLVLRRLLPPAATRARWTGPRRSST